MDCTPACKSDCGDAVGSGGWGTRGGGENRTCAGGLSSSAAPAEVKASVDVPPVTRLNTLAASVENVSTLLRIPPRTENITLERPGPAPLDGPTAVADFGDVSEMCLGGCEVNKPAAALLVPSAGEGCVLAVVLSLPPAHAVGNVRSCTEIPSLTHTIDPSHWHQCICQVYLRHNHMLTESRLSDRCARLFICLCRGGIMLISKPVPFDDRHCLLVATCRLVHLLSGGG